MRHFPGHVYAGVLFLSVAATFLVAGPAVAADPASDFSYSLSGGTATITGYLGANLVVDIPASITDAGVDYPVSTIGINAFRLLGLTAVTIPGSVTTIDDNAFRGNLLTTIEIPDSVTSIGTYAFYNNALTAVAIPDSLTSISNNAFRGNALTSITIPDSVTSIGNNSFNSNSLTTVTIPGSVTSIGNGTFVDNPLLATVILGGNAPGTFTAAGPTGSLGTGAGLTVYYYAGTSGFTSPWNGYTVRAISAAESDLSVTPNGTITADGTSAFTATVTVRDDTHTPVAEIPVAFTVPAGLTASATGCTTATDGTCTVSFASNAAATYAIIAKIGADPTALTQDITFTADATASTTPPADADPALAATGSDLSSLLALGAGFFLLGAGMLTAALIRRRSALS